MERSENPQSANMLPADINESDMTIPQLVGTIYNHAPASERCRMLEHLIKPLGALALAGVCDGIFAKLWFRSGWHNLRIQPEDALSVQPGHVVSLVDYVQQASSETVSGLASLLAASPMTAYSAATAVLVTLLVRRIKTRRT